MKRIYWLTLYAVITHPECTGEELGKEVPWLATYSLVGIEAMLGKLVQDRMIGCLHRRKRLVYDATDEGIQHIADIFLSLKM